MSKPVDDVRIKQQMRAVSINKLSEQFKLLKSSTPSACHSQLINWVVVPVRAEENKRRPTNVPSAS